MYQGNESVVLYWGKREDILRLRGSEEKRSPVLVEGGNELRI